MTFEKAIFTLERASLALAVVAEGVGLVVALVGYERRDAYLLALGALMSSARC